MKRISFIIALTVALAASLFAGIMIGTAGGALYTPLYRAAAPFVCDGEFYTESQRYSYKPGETGVTHAIYCRDEATGEAEEITGRAVLVSTLVYSALTLPFALLMVWPVMHLFTRAAGESFAPLVSTFGRESTGYAGVAASPATGGGASYSGTTFVYNGRTYSSPEEMPPEARAAYEKVSSAFNDSDGDGVPDLFEHFVADASAQAGETGRQAPSVRERLRELERLRADGLITNEEYEEKRSRILNEL